MKNKITLKKLLKLIIYFFFFILLCFSIFVRKRFNKISFEQLLYNILYTKGANYDIVFEGIFFIFKIFLITITASYILYKMYMVIKQKTSFEIKFLQGFINIIKKKKSILCLLLFCFICTFSSLKLLNIDDYIINQSMNTSLFDKHYVDGRNINLTFPNKKRNLIYIFLESMEASNISLENGGLVNKTYIPNLEKLAINYINFSNNDKIGGAYQVSNSEWTIAALISQTAGIPMKLSINSNLYNNNIVTLKGAYTLGDILKDNGYNNYFMIGSDAEFGMRDKYFEEHGDYTIYDYYFAIDEELIESDYFVWWGYEDKKLYENAKKKIMDASKLKEPFNFTILTVDTHFTDGYLSEDCDEIFDSNYANVLYCSDSQVYSFINWIKKQDFYENTTVIITGDHLTLQPNFYDKKYDSRRTIYNSFINSPIKPQKEKNRIFSSFDMFPTTLAALGVEIEGERLGLGVNLFSLKPTLFETYGIEYINNELLKKSSYYENKLLK